MRAEPRDDFLRSARRVFRQNLIPLSGRRPMLSRQAKERLRDCRQEGRPAVGVRRAATEGRRTFWGWGGEQPDGRTDPIVANRLSWIRPPGGRSDGGGHRLRESG